MARIILFLFIAIVWRDARSQSSLAPCPLVEKRDWTNCVGTRVVDDDGTAYVGGFKQNEFHGEGALISTKGHTLVEGYWRDDFTVDTNGGRWRWVGLSDQAIWFVLTTSIRQDGAYRRAWAMRAYKEEPIDRWLSAREIRQFDCANNRTRLIQATIFAGSWGSGDVVTQFNGDDWEYTVPGSAFENIEKYVCSRRLISKQY